MREGDPKLWRVKTKNQKDKEMALILESVLNDKYMRAFLFYALSGIAASVATAITKKGEHHDGLEEEG